MKLSNSGIRVLLSIALIIFIINITSAETYTWLGTHNHNWLLAENWSPVGIPGGEDNVIIAQGDHDL